MNLALSWGFPWHRTRGVSSQEAKEGVGEWRGGDCAGSPLLVGPGGGSTKAASSPLPAPLCPTLSAVLLRARLAPPSLMASCWPRPYQLRRTTNLIQYKYPTVILILVAWIVCFSVWRPWSGDVALFLIWLSSYLRVFGGTCAQFDHSPCQQFISREYGWKDFGRIEERRAHSFEWVIL